MPAPLPVLPGLSLAVAVERFPIAGAFTISRGSRTEAVVVTATVSGGGVSGRAECVPYARYGETVEGVAATLEAQGPRLAAGGPLAELTRGLKGRPPTRSIARCGTTPPRRPASASGSWRASPPRSPSPPATR